jgi:uncharacterized protein (TIGR01319 family)
VHSVVEVDPETGDLDRGGLSREVVATTPVTRTVEGDLGMRWSAPGVVDAAVAERLLDGDDAYALRAEAQARHDDPSLLPASDHDRDVDATLARLALTVALRRHARPTETAEGRTPGRDLSRLSLVVASGGVMRHGDPDHLPAMLTPVTDDLAGGWRLPASPRVTVDRRYVVAAAGLLADDHRDAAQLLLAGALVDVV